jgi:hypothetical protein
VGVWLDVSDNAAISNIPATPYSAPTIGTTLNPDLFNFQLNNKKGT